MLHRRGVYLLSVIYRIKSSGGASVETDKIFPDNWKEVIQEKKVIFFIIPVLEACCREERSISKR